MISVFSKIWKIIFRNVFTFLRKHKKIRLLKTKKHTEM